MSYNGIGLSTPRGSGTSGYVQRNYAAVRPKRKDGRQDPEKAFGSDTLLHARQQRTPNADILQHQQKRAIELKCAELDEKMESQGYTEEERQDKVQAYRMQLLHSQTAGAASEAK